MILRIALLVFSVGLGSMVCAQQEALIDSLEQDLASRPPDDTLRILTLVNLWRQTSNNSLDKAAAYARAIIREGQQMNYPKGTATGYQRLGITQDYLGQTDSAIVNYNRALDIYRELEIVRLQGIMLFNLATIYQNKGAFDTTDLLLARADSCFADGQRFIERSAVNKARASAARQRGRNDESITHARLAYELAREGGDSSRMADAEQEIAFAYQALGDYATAADYFQRGATFFSRNNDLYFATVSLLNLATCRGETGSKDDAIAIARQALEISLDNNFASLELDVRNVLGNLFWGKDQFELAEEQFLLALSLSEEQENKRLGAEFLSYLTAVQYHLKKYRAAKANGVKALALSEAQGQIELSHRTYGHLASIASESGNYREAYNYLVLRQEIQDSLQDQTLNEKLAELTLLFEKEKQDRLITEQQNKLALLEAQSNVDRLQKRSLWLGLLAVVGLFGAIAYSLWQRNQRQQMEQEQLAAKVAGQQRELSAAALQMAQKGQLLDQLGEELRQVKGERPDDRKKLDGMLRELSSEERINQDWANFRTYFQGVHGDFEARLKAAAAQKLSPRELRLAALVKMQLNNQEIGSILSVSQDSLYKAKYRLRKKLPGAGEGELDAFLQAL